MSCWPALGQRMQFPTQLPLDSAPALGPGTAPGPAATFQGTIQPPATWDPYATPGAAQPTLLPQDPTLPSSPNLLPGGVTSVQRFMQGVHLDYHWLVGNGPEEFGTNDCEIYGTFAFPFFYNQQNPLLVTPGFGFHLFNGPVSIPDTQPIDLPASVYDAYLEAGWNPQVTQWLSGELAFRVGVYTDFDRVDVNSVRFTGRGYAVLWFSPSLQVKVGVMYLDRVRIKLLPAGGIIWTPNPDVRFEILFPNPRLSKRLSTVGNTDWWLYCRGDYGGGTWTVVRDSPVPPPAVPPFLYKGELQQFDYNDMRVAVGLELRGIRGLTGNFEAGFAFEREILFNNATRQTFRPHNTVFVGAGLLY